MQKKIILSVIILILIIGSLLLVFESNVKYKSSFKIEDRTSKIKDEKKKDNENFDTIGWIRLEGTNIDMPLILAKNEDADFPVERKKYAWVTNDKSKLYNKMNILGHNIFNLSSNPIKHSNTFDRFEELMDFVYYDFAQKNQYIQLTLNDKDYVYKIFSVSFVDAFEVSIFPENEYSKGDLEYHMGVLKEGEIYKYDTDVNYDDKMISLITCTRFFGDEKSVDFVVTGRLLRKNEKIKLSKVTKTKRYKEVEKVMKGDDKNEEV